MKGTGMAIDAIHANSIFGIPRMVIMQAIILGLFFLVIYWLFRNNKTESANDILKKRYAKGEISKKEFSKLQKDIE